MIYLTASLPSTCAVILPFGNVPLRSGHISQRIGIILGELSVVPCAMVLELSYAKAAYSVMDCDQVSDMKFFVIVTHALFF